jgi:hypothetical protein
MTSHMSITLNARLRPLDRGARYEDPLQEAIVTAVPGSHVSGGGTLLSAEREPLVCDIDLEVAGDAREVLALVTGVLDAAGAPKGSQARLEAGDTVPFGVTEGVAVYLNGTDLPAHVYASGDVNDLIAALLERLGAEGDMQSWWQGPRETALYLYGPSAVRVTELITGVLARYQLAERCRVVPLELTLPARR